MPDFFKMTPVDLIATFLQYEEHLKESKRLLATCGGLSSNLALKSRLEEFDDDEEEDEYEDDDNSDDTHSYDDISLFVKKFTKRDFKGRFQKKKTRNWDILRRMVHMRKERTNLDFLGRMLPRSSQTLSTTSSRRKSYWHLKGPIPRMLVVGPELLT